MIEFIVNMLIIGAIIYSVIKRAQEVAEQGKKNAGPPKGASPAGPPVPDRTVPGPAKRAAGPKDTVMPAHRESRRPPTPAHTEQKPQTPDWEVPDHVKELLRERMRRLDDTLTETRGAIRDTLDEEAEPSFDDLPSYDTGRRPEPLPTGSAPGRATVSAAYLRFGRDDIVRGIIMKEVLGPPVSMRRFDEYGGSAW